MQNVTYLSFNALVEKYLGMQMPQQMADAVCLPDLPPDTRAFIVRMLALMKHARYAATDFSPALMRWLSTTIPSMLPSAWGGKIPPITLPNRHKKLDAYVVNSEFSPGKGHNLFVDLGCGFPPVTTIETARRLKDWKVVGVDNSFADYVLYDPEGHYACFDKRGAFQYFQAFFSSSGRNLYADAKKTRRRFNTLFKDLLPLFENLKDNRSETVEKDGCRLVRHHIRDFESENLTFLKMDIASLALPPAKVVRCMNLLIYFEPETRRKMLRDIIKLLDEGGMLIAGTNGLGIQSRYAVYRKNNDALYADEFAFSLDNLGPLVFMPHFTIHEGDPEAGLLADLMGIIRADRSFRTDFGNRVDELLNQHEVCHRGPDGFLVFPEDLMPPAVYMEKNDAIWRRMTNDGYLEKTVDVLTRAGYTAWINPVGDIAVRPPADASTFVDL